MVFVLSQVNDHLISNKLFSPLQSAYKPHHSTETALLKIVNDLLTALDNGKICILTLLDLSAAFDTIDHNILLHRLEHTFGISDSALSWFRSYLSDRTQIVTVNGLRSDEAPLSSPGLSLGARSLCPVHTASVRTYQETFDSASCICRR